MYDLLKFIFQKSYNHILNNNNVNNINDEAVYWLDSTRLTLLELALKALFIENEEC